MRSRALNLTLGQLVLDWPDIFTVFFAGRFWRTTRTRGVTTISIGLVLDPAYKISTLFGMILLPLGDTMDKLC